MDIEQVLRRSPIVLPILDRWEHIGLPECWLVAGAVFQTMWNEAYGLAAEHGIKDIDLVYFDAGDLSVEAEIRHEARINDLFADLAVPIDVKNEARVHLWYAEKFGYSIRPYTSTAGAIATFPITAGSIGVRPGADGLEFCAPFGLTDLCDLIVRPNKVQITEAIYVAKLDRWRTLWPRLKIIDWNAA